jgi:hypothetical protein
VPVMIGDAARRAEWRSTCSNGASMWLVSPIPSSRWEGPHPHSGFRSPHNGTTLTRCQTLSERLRIRCRKAVLRILAADMKRPIVLYLLLILASCAPQDATVATRKRP